MGLRLVRQFSALGGLEVLEVPAGAETSAVLRACQADASVRMAEPDHWVQLARLPDDLAFVDGRQWSLRNTGQDGGLPDADIDAPEAWDRQAASSNIIVAVVDTGIWITHEDLAANLWVNPGEVPGNGLDDDHNGFVDDVNGINAMECNGRVNDASGHGTHAAGIIGAVGDNGKGIAGLTWNVRLMAGRFIGSGGSGSISDAVTCLEYARTMGAHVINASWVDTEYSSALEQALALAREAGIIVVAAAGNDGKDNDQVPYYPANLPSDNIITVAATTSTDDLLSTSNFKSNYGAQNVDLGAPGLNIYSTFFIADNNYATMSGTSQAAPHVAGAAALVRAAFPNADYREVISRILCGVDPLPTLEGKCVTGGRLNLNQALDPEPLTLAPRILRATAENAGGPFRVNAQVFTLANRSAVSRTWSAETSGAWITLTPTHGTLAPGLSAKVTASLNDQASQLPPGAYTNVLRFIDQTEGSAPMEVVWNLALGWPARLSPVYPAAPNQSFQIDLTGEPGATYVTEITGTLTSWRALSTNTVPASGLVPAAATDTGTSTFRAFRARRLP